MNALLLFFGLAATPNVGEVAPDFTVKDTDGRVLTLSKLVEQGPVVLAFFPKAFTSGCTRELVSYREHHADIVKHRGTVIAISTDDLQTQTKFKASLSAPYSFVADSDAVLVKLYEVKMPVLKLSKRATFVVGAGRKVLSKQEGEDAIETSGAVQACTLVANEALKVVTGSDAGAPK